MNGRERVKAERRWAWGCYGMRRGREGGRMGKEKVTGTVKEGLREERNKERGGKEICGKPGP